MDNKIPHILIVDDDANLLETMSDILKLKGFDPIKAQTGGMALALLEKQNFDVALIDLRLGDMSGLIILRTIKTHSPETECILLTGHASQNTAIEAIQMGVYGYFQKPFDMEQVLLSIQRALEKKQSVQNLHKSEERFRGLFNDSPVAIWEEDFSEVKKRLDSLKKLGIADFGAYFANHPEAVFECAALIKILDVNNAALRMYRTESREELFESTFRSLSKGEQEHLQDDFIKIAEGKTSNSWEGEDETATGEPIEISLGWSVSPGHEDDFSKVIVTTIDVTERKQAVNALQNSEKRFRALIENGRDNISLLAADGTLLWESPSTRSTLGYAPDQFVGRSIFELLHPDDQGSLQDSYAQLVQSPGATRDGIFRLRHGDGTWRWIESTTTNMLNEPSVQAIVINYRDITERVQAEEKIAQTEKRFRSLIENAPDGVVLVGLDGKYKYASPAALRVFNYSIEDALGSNPNEQTHPEDLPMVLGVLQDIIENPTKVPTIQYRFLHKDGSWRWVESTFTNLLAEPGVEAIVINFRDVTEHKQAQEAQQESELQFQALFELSPDAVILIDPHDPDISWPIIDCNEAACQMNGYHRDELIGHSIDIVDTVPGAQAERDIYLKRLREAGNVKLETFHRHKNGTVFPIEVSTSIILVGSRELIIGIDRDITQRKQAEDDLRQSEQRFQQLANNIQETFWITDAESGRELYISPAAEKVWGIPVENLYQGLYLFLENILLEDKQIALDAIERQLRGEKTEIEYRIQHPNGSIRWIWDRAFPILDETGKVLRVAGITADITERKQAEEALQESEQKYRLLFDEMLSGVAVHEILCDEKGKPVNYRFLSINTAFEKMTGLVAAEVIGKTVLEVLPATESLWIERYGQVALTRVPTQFENYSNELGKYFEVRAFSPEKGKFATIFNDITERKKSEEALRESETLYRQAIEVAGAVPYLQSYDSNGTNIHYNFIGEGIRQITGYSVEEFNTTLFDSLIQESILLDDLAGYSMEEAIRKVRSGQIPLWKCEHCLRARDGKTHWVFEAAVELYAENGVAKGSIGMFQDITERKLADLALAKERNLLRTLLDILPDRIYVKDTECRFLLKNLVDALSLGTSPDAMVGKSDADYYPPELAARYYADDQAVIQSGQPLINHEEPVVGVDGNLRWILTTKVPWRDSVGRIIGLVGIGHDITERKQVEENVRQRVKELELLYESGLAFSQLINPKQIAQKIIELLEEKMDWHHTAIRLLHGQDELELVAFDQPGLKDTELQAVEARFKNLISRIGEGLSGWALHQSQIIRLGDVSSDPHYVETYPGLHSGLYVPLKSGDHLVGVISIESEQPNAFSEADEHLISTLANQAANAFENARLYEESNRHAQELEQRVQERTADLSRVNLDLAHAVRVKDEFLASMSHELRTPLTGILGLSEVLQLKVYGELNDKQSKTLKTIEEAGRHLLELINDILDLSKIEAGKLELQFAPCSLADVCQASLQLIKGMAQQKRQHIYYAPPPKPIIIRADARRLKQLLVNLLGNAIKFTRENGDLGLEIEPVESERKVKVTVWDKGIGIRPDDLQKIFKPFTQVDSGLAREYSGTGLGLSLVQHLTKLHNGSIEVESKIGEGSRFTIILPWSPHDTTPIPYPHLPQHAVTGRLSLMADKGSASPLVVVVDDNETILQIVSDFLETKQYRVMKIHSGSELLERVAELHPDIMLVDIQMPGIGGLETITRIRAHPDPRVAAAPVIAITALAMPSDRENCLQAGANDYMSKPLKLNELAAIIHKLLERNQ